MSKNNRKHHHLLTGEITFTAPGAKENDIRTLLINGVLLTSTKGLLMRDIGRAQQVLQMNLHNSMRDDSGQDSGVAIHNVVLTNVSYLGFFSEEEWKAPPAGTKLAERPNLKVVRNEPEVNTELSPEEAMAKAQQKQVDADLGASDEQA